MTVCVPGNVGGHWLHTYAWAMKVLHTNFHHHRLTQESEYRHRHDNGFFKKVNIQVGSQRRMCDVDKRWGAFDETV